MGNHGGFQKKRTEAAPSLQRPNTAGRTGIGVQNFDGRARLGASADPINQVDTRNLEACIRAPFYREVESGPADA